MPMEYIERAAAALLFRERTAGLVEDEFEKFFQTIMSYTDPSFISVRAAGRMGDKGADGLLLVGAKLYACYAPEVFNYEAVQNKFLGDLEKAVRKREGQFTTFVFVHNDTRGVHPAVTEALATAAVDHAAISFERIGPLDLLRRLRKLEREEVEDILGTAIPVKALTFSVGIEDLTPVLEHLVQAKSPSTRRPIPPVSFKKMNWNKIEDDLRSDLVRALRSTHMVQNYYNQLRDPAVRDAVAVELRREYESIATTTQDPEEIVWQLERFIVGNESRPLNQRRAVMVILAHFFETCDIFDDAPKGFEEDVREAEAV